MLTNFIQPCILEPTRVVNGNKPSLIDNIFTNAINKKIVSGNLLNKISDHMPSFIIAFHILTPHNKEDRKIRDHKKMNVEQFKKDMDCINIEHYLHEAEDINQPYNVYQDELVKVIDKHIPFKYLSRKEFRWKLKPWITNGIKKSIKLKNKYYKKYIKNKSNYWFKLYKFYLNSIKRLTFASKRNYYKKYFEQNINNCKKIWNGINEVLKNHKKSANEEIFLNEDGMVITDQKRVANSFNHFYTNVADNLLMKIGNTTTKYQDYLKNPNEHSFYMNEVDFGEVYKI